MITDKQNKYLPLKRVLDVALSGSAIVVLSPILGLLALAIKLDSPGPVLFKQKRVGKNKELFEIYKFRTMRMETPSDTPTHMLKNPDQFITKTGEFLRKTSLDELPQIFNIFSGKMSIIGPRPALWNQDDLIVERDKYHANDVAPGLTGWAQINGRDKLEIDVKARFDGDYVKNMTLKMDIKCFLATIGSVLLHDGVVEGATRELEETVATQIVYPEKVVNEAEIGTLVGDATEAVGSAGSTMLYKHCKNKRNIENKKKLHKIASVVVNCIVFLFVKKKKDEKRLIKDINSFSKKTTNNDEIELVGKKVLFFSPSFFGYENEIKNCLEKNGAYVDMYDVRSVSKARDKALLKIFPYIFNSKSKKYYTNILLENKDKDYDYILIVKCDMTPISTLKEMKKLYSNAKLCLYLWDSIDNIPGILRKLQCFDSLHSFDIEDCKKYPILEFRPLFYCDQYKREINVRKAYKYDISFLGTIHSDRYKVIKQIDKFCKKNRYYTYWFRFLQSRFIYSFYKLVKSEFRDTTKGDFDFEKMSSEEISKVVDESKTILDIQHPKQTGLTMRTIEMIGMNKKIITTNKTIREYDFYNPNNICVINRKNIDIDLDFFDKDYVKLEEKIYEKYSLNQWIKDVLS